MVTLKTAKRNPQPEHPLLLITGDGRTLFEDLTTFKNWAIPHDVMAIGRSIKAVPGTVKHWANVDGPDSKWWAEHLPLKNNGDIPIRHTIGPCDGYDIDWDDGVKFDEPWLGSSALFAVFAGLALGYAKCVLAGCPLDSEGHWFAAPEERGPEWSKDDLKAWSDFALMPESERVRSLSGYTAQILGKPEKEWICL